MASPAIHAARVVSPSTESARVADTQIETIVAPPTASTARSDVRPPRPAHRWWAVPLLALALLVLAAIGVAVEALGGTHA